MRPFQLVRRSLRHYWRTNLAVVCGVGVAVAVLAGALLVGESVRASLRELAVGRLGRTDHLIAATHFFRQALVQDLTKQPAFASCCAGAYGLIAVDGLVARPEGGAGDEGARASGVAVYGIDEQFWAFHGRPSPGALRPREAWLSPALARELGVADAGGEASSAGASGGGREVGVGVGLLVRLQQPSAIPLGTLHGRRDEAGKTIRVSARGALPAGAMGEFSLRPRQGDVRAIFLPIARLQTDMGQPDRINAILVSARDDGGDAAARGAAGDVARELERLLAPSLQLEDAALKLRALPGDAGFALESDSSLLSDAVTEVAKKAAASPGASAPGQQGPREAPRPLRVTPVLTYLAHTIRSGGREIPYSVVSAVDLDAAAVFSNSSPPRPPSPLALQGRGGRATPSAEAGGVPISTTVRNKATGGTTRSEGAKPAEATKPNVEARSGAATKPSVEVKSGAAAKPSAKAGSGGATKQGGGVAGAGVDRPTAPDVASGAAADGTSPIWLNAWSADALQVKPGATIAIDYDVWDDAGGLVRHEASFTLAGVLPMEGAGADATLTPEYPGITGEESLSDWDPPFPLDLSRITPRDEDYWRRYRAAPKAIITLADGQRLWGSRFGKLTSLRLAPLRLAPLSASPSARLASPGGARVPSAPLAPADAHEPPPPPVPAAGARTSSTRGGPTSGRTAAGAPERLYAAPTPVSSRVAPSPSPAIAAAMGAYRKVLQASLDPTTAGFVVQPVRATALTAASGTTDFGEYFLYFSFFIVVSGLLLAGLFFRLGVEQRLREVGLLQALGFTPRLVRRLFLLEGLALAVVGSLIGVVGAVAYAALIMLGLRTWWVGAVGTTALTLQPSVTSLLIGAVAGVITAVLAIAWTLRGVTRLQARTLLHGETGETVEIAATAVSSVGAATERGEDANRVGGDRDARARRTDARGRGAAPGRGAAAARRRRLLFVACLVLAIGLTMASAVRAIDQTAGFFGAGGAALIAALAGLSLWLHRRPAMPTPAPTARALWRFGQLNAAARPGRTVLSVALIAFATFVIVTVGAFRQDGVSSPEDSRSGTGGYAVIAESVAPIADDPNTPAGRRALGLDSPDLQPMLAGASIARFRLRPGDDGSCLNLYRPENPRVVAPAEAFVMRGGRFTFASSLAETDAERANPWLLLHRTFPDGAVPVIIDLTSLMYVFHKSLGDDIVLARGSGLPITLRVVAALSHSVFQSELIVGEAAFVRLFPGNEGYRLFLVEVDARRTDVVGRTLENRLADYGVEATGTADRLRAYQQVENTYLSTFQALGALGLVLGTFGVGTVLLRNILERRRELALLQAIGYREGHVRSLILAESVSLVVWGLAAGAACALLAVLPAIVDRGGRFPWAVLVGLLAAVLAAGFLSSIAATRMAVRLPLLASLRAE